jgi:hypothetical protein
MSDSIKKSEIRHKSEIRQSKNLVKLGLSKGIHNAILRVRVRVGVRVRVRVRVRVGVRARV